MKTKRRSSVVSWTRRAERGLLTAPVAQTLSQQWNRFRVDPVAYLESQHSLEYLEPQANWTNGCPMGNGDMGVLAYGPPEATLFMFGKTNLWDDTPFGEANFCNEGFAELRDVLARGDVEQFERLKSGAVTKPRRDAPTAKPGGMLRLELFPSAIVSRFKQRLSFAHAETVQTWVPSGDRKQSARGLGATDSQIELTSLVHAARNVFVARVAPGKGATWHEPVHLTFWRYADPDMDAPQYTTRKDRFWLRQDLPGGGHFVLMGALDGGGIAVSECAGRIHGHGVPKRPHLTVYVTLVTSRDCANPLREAHANIDAAQAAGFARLRKSHRRWWHGFWQRGFVCTPWPKLERAWYQALYQQASICRPGRMSPGLQGNWIKEHYPAWNADFHNNINMQVLYWGQYTANRLELAEPLYRLMWDVLEQCKADTARYFRMRGARYPISMGPDGVETAPGMLLNTWIGAGGWLAQHFWWHYTYSGDRAFLRSYAYPLLKECALFYEDYLQEDADGRLYLFPTVQMEINVSRIDGAGTNSSWDLPVVVRTFDMVIAAADELGVDADDRARWHDIQRRLPSVPANQDGVWMEFADKGGLWHIWDWARFMPIFPMELVGQDSGPEALREQAQNTIDEYYRYRDKPDQVPGFAGAIQAVALLRMGHAERGMRTAEFVVTSLSPSGFVWTYDGHYLQVDAPPGLSIFLNEMLLQSYDGVLRVFPAVPDTAEPIRFHSLRAQGGFLVTAERRDRLTQYVIVQSLCGNPLRLRNPFLDEPDRAVQVKVYALDEDTRLDSTSAQAKMTPCLDHMYLPGQVIEFPTQKNRAYIVSKEIPWITNVPIVEV